MTAGVTFTAVPLVTAPTALFTLPVPLLKTAVKVVDVPAVIVVAADVKLVIVGAGTTVIVIVPEMAVPPCESVIFAVKLKDPGVTVDMIVPEMLPDVPKLKPFGRFPELTTQVKGPTPPVAARDVKG